MIWITEVDKSKPCGDRLMTSKPMTIKALKIKNWKIMLEAEWSLAEAEPFLVWIMSGHLTLTPVLNVNSREDSMDKTPKSKLTDKTLKDVHQEIISQLSQEIKNQKADAKEQQDRITVLRTERVQLNNKINQLLTSNQYLLLQELKLNKDFQALKSKIQSCIKCNQNNQDLVR